MKSLRKRVMAVVQHARKGIEMKMGQGRIRFDAPMLHSADNSAFVNRSLRNVWMSCSDGEAGMFVTLWIP
jgi:hypothetical protein